MDQLVKLVPCKSVSKFAHVYLKQNRISYFKKDTRRHAVYQQVVLGSVSQRDFLGITFMEGNIWVFVPEGFESLPQSWYFGNTRVDSVAGYLKATGREVIPDA